MELLRLKCPVCHAADIQYHSPYTTKNYSDRVIYKCNTCPAYFSETKNTFLEGLKTPDFSDASFQRAFMRISGQYDMKAL